MRIKKHNDHERKESGLPPLLADSNAIENDNSEHQLEETVEMALIKPSKDVKMMESMKDKRPLGKRGGGISLIAKKTMRVQEFDADFEFFLYAEVNNLERPSVEDSEEAMKNFEEVNFDSLHFNGVYLKCSLHYMIYEIYKRYDFRCHYRIKLETMYTFSNELSKGYFKESKFHNQIHIIDSL